MRLTASATASHNGFVVLMIRQTPDRSAFRRKSQRKKTVSAVMAAGLLPVEILRQVVPHAAAVREKLAHRRRAVVRREVRQPVGDRRVELEQPARNELRRRRRGHHFADRADAEAVLGQRGDLELEIGDAERRGPQLSVSVGDGQRQGGRGLRRMEGAGPGIGIGGRSLL